ncbi:MAG TPA: ATP-binding protein [Methylomirabilota bacterium]|nr:ATP-binding protein [Methylomirabilota bacterium]
MKIARYLNLPQLLEKKSFFLFGPRATGKTFLIREQLADRAFVIDLLRSDLYLRLSGSPADLEALIAAHGSCPVVVIDEVQKVPPLLDEVHRLIENRGVKFLLTGSSARKLRRGQANLLAGRAWQANLFPLTWIELKEQPFALDRYLRYGGLPTVYLSQDPQEELHAYVNTYLYEEIQAEGLVRRLPQFARFLQVAALSSGQMLNFASIGNDAQVSPSTVREYYYLLEDTLLGFMLPPWTKSRKRKAIATAKFYLFDTGVTHTLAGTDALDRNSDLYGRSFEHWLAMELRAALSYHRVHKELSYWRSTHHHEVDFIIGDEVAVEVKASQRVSDRDGHGLRALKEEGTIKRFYLVSQDPVEMVKEGIQRVHWQTFLSRLWQGEL